MALLDPKEKGAIAVGATIGGVPSFTVVKPTADGQVLVSDSTVNEGVKFAAPSAGAVDPRDIMRFSMIHNVGVTGGG